MNGMPSAGKHYRQYLHNMDFLNTDVFNDSNEYTDWYVTAVFYCAVHLVERELAKTGYHLKNHTSRANFVMMASNLKPISCEYNFLYNESRRARYDCVKFSPQDLTTIKEKYEIIENLLVKTS
jgi:hypothetical protein